jgi:hypothetical protein
MSATTAKRRSATSSSHIVPASYSPPRSWTPERATVVLIAVGIAARILIASQVGLGHDEGSNYSCSRHLDLGYFDHPPMCAFLGRVSTEIFGAIGPITLRMPSILFFAGTTALMFLIGRRLFGSWPGFYAAALLNLAPVFSMTTGIALTPDGPLMFFWLAAVWFITRLSFDPSPSWPIVQWSGVGACLGLAMLSKYNAVLLIPGTLLFVCTRREQRHWLRHPGPYVALLVATAVFSPALVWNAEHGWVSFAFQGTRGAVYDGLHPDWMVRSIGGQALWMLPWIWIVLGWELISGFRCRIIDSRRWYISCLAATPIALFTIVAIYSRIGLIFHWQGAGYLLLFLPAGDRLHRYLSVGGRRARMARAWWRFCGIGSIIAMLAVVTHTVTGWGLRLLPDEIADQVGPLDPTLEAADFDGLSEVLAEHGLLNQETLVGASRWFLAGKVDYAIRSRAPVLCLIEPDPRVYAFFHSQNEWLGKDIVLVNMRRYIDEPVDAYVRYFDHIELIASIPIRRGNRADRTLDVYRCTNFRRTLPHPYGIDVGLGERLFNGVRNAQPLPQSK